MGDSDREFQVDPRLEMLSDKVRQGVPVKLGEALEVVGYQERKRVWNKLRKSRRWYPRLLNWLSGGR
jgi:hypothetical protein